MRYCKQNRKRKGDGATNYDEYQNALVCKKHSVHDGLQRNSPSPSQMPPSTELEGKGSGPAAALAATRAILTTRFDLDTLYACHCGLRHA